jgi:hypothetical protein
MPITLTIIAEDAAALNDELRILLQHYFVVGTVARAATADQAQDKPIEQTESATTSPSPPSGNGSAATAEPAQEEKAAPAPRGSGKQGNVSTASGKAAKGKAQAAQNTPKLERTDVRRALTSYLALHDEPATAKLLKQFGKVDKLSELAEERFQAVYDAAMA